MPEVLKVLQLTQHHCMAEMKIRSGRVDAEIDAEGLSGFHRVFEFSLEFGLGNDFGNALFQVGELFFDGFEFRFSHEVFRLFEPRVDLRF